MWSAKVYVTPMLASPQHGLGLDGGMELYSRFSTSFIFSLKCHDGLFLYLQNICLELYLRHSYQIHQ